MVHTNSHRFRGPGKKQNFKEAGLNLFADLGVSQKGRKKLTQPGNKDTMAATWESPFYHGTLVLVSIILESSL